MQRKTPSRLTAICSCRRPSRGTLSTSGRRSGQSSIRCCRVPQSVLQRWSADLRDFVKQTGADELMITSQIFDHSARLRSFEIAAEAFADMPLDRIA
jgi:hypothetical protein